MTVTFIFNINVKPQLQQNGGIHCDAEGPNPNPFSAAQDDLLDGSNFLLHDDYQEFMQEERRPVSTEVIKSAKERAKKQEHNPSNQHRVPAGGFSGSRVTM
jgi:hypothetical protein